LDTTGKLFFRPGTCVFFFTAGFWSASEAARYCFAGARYDFLTGATPHRAARALPAFSSAKFGLRAVAQAMAREPAQEYPRRASPERRRGDSEAITAHEGGEKGWAVTSLRTA